MPAAALEASAPGTDRSSTITLRPACASRRATAQPCTPAPMITMSDFIDAEGYLRTAHPASYGVIHCTSARTTQDASRMLAVSHSTNGESSATTSGFSAT
jgi:hypothetical protein